MAEQFSEVMRRTPAAEEVCMLGEENGVVSMSAETFNVLQADANRYRYLRAHAQGRSLHMDGTQYWYIGSQAVRYRGRTLDEAIDRHLVEAVREDS